MHKRYEKNAVGSDYVVGDIHGCFSKLRVMLEEMGFDQTKDRLFSVGDLVDRGPESELACEWLAEPWFHAVRGNHEQMAIDAANGMFDYGTYVYNGGAWFLGLTAHERRQFADAFSALPITMEIDTPDGLVGIVHGECPTDTWERLKNELAGDRADLFAQACLWGRERITSRLRDDVNGVAKVFVGHTPVTEPVTLGNVHYIDTGAVFGRPLTIVKIN